jgi:hypothetical protein
MSCDIERPAKGDQNQSGDAEGHSKWLMVGAIALAMIVGWTSPTRGTWLFLLVALGMIGLLLFLRGAESRTRWLSVKVHPGVVVLLTTFFAGLVASELALRIFLFQKFPDFERMSPVRLGYKYDPTLGWFPAPNSHEDFGYLQGTVAIDHNSRGFRDPEPTFDSRPRILFLGDSFTWGYCVDRSERFSDRLRQRHPEWQVDNFGVVGYGNDQEFLLLQRHFQEYKPRVVFLIFCTENDHTDNCINGDPVWAFKPYFTVDAKGLKLHGVPVPYSDWVFCLRHPWISKPYLFRLAMRAWGNIRSPRPSQEHDPTTAILAALQKYVKDQGAVFCVGTTGRDDKLEKFMRDSGIPWLDLSTDLRLEGDWHWSSAGNAHVAGKIEEFLLKEKLF